MNALKGTYTCIALNCMQHDEEIRTNLLSMQVL